MSVLNKATLG